MNRQRPPPVRPPRRGAPAAKDAARLVAAAAVRKEWQNGFCIVTGKSMSLKDQVTTAIEAKR